MAAGAPYWRDLILVHPAAKLFPMMGAEELLALGEDIRTNGLKQRIVLFRPEDADAPCSVLDGRNRLAAMASVGLTIVENGRVTVDADYRDETPGFDPIAYVVSANLHRRHLTTEQKREVIAALLKANPERSDRATATIAKVSDKTVAAVRTGLEASAEIPQLDKRIGSDGKGRPQPATKAAPAEKTVRPVSGLVPHVSQALLEIAARSLLRTSQIAGRPVEPSAPPPDLLAPDLIAERERRKIPEPKDPRARAVVAFAELLHEGNLDRSLEDMRRLLNDERQRIGELPLQKRVALARGYLAALGVRPEDLRPVEAGLP